MPTRIFLAFFLISVAHWGDSFWSPKFGVLLFWAGLELAILIAKRSHWTLGLAVFYTLASILLKSALTDVFPTPGQVSLTMFHAFLHKWAMSTTGLTMALIMLPFCLFKRREWHAFWMATAMFCFYDSVFVIVETVFRVTRAAGFGGEHSMNGMLIAVTYPVLLHAEAEGIVFMAIAPLVAIVPVIAVFCANSSTAVGALAVAVAALFFLSTAGSLKSRVGIGVALAAMISLVAFCVQGVDLFHVSDRYEGWVRAVRWFSTLGWREKAFGTGGGSLLTLTPWVLGKFPLGDYWWHLHSDVLRVVVEQGFVGAAFWASAVAVAMKNAAKEPWLFSGLAGAVAMCLVQYPSSMPLHCLMIGGMLFYASYRRMRSEHWSRCSFVSPR